MSKERGRTYTEIKKSMTTKQFDEYCAKLAVEYARSDARFSSTYFKKNENMKESCFYLMLRDAVVKNLVSDEIVDRMEEKAKFNQSRHYENAGMTTHIHYLKLRQKRREYMLSTYSNEKIDEIARDFANSTEMSLEEVGQKHGIDKMLLNCILKKAFVENITDDSTCRRIETRSMKRRSNDPLAKKQFEEMWEKRKLQRESSK